MNIVTLSADFQIVIPVAIREAAGLTPGSRMAVVQRGKAIHLVPVPTLEELKVELNGCGSGLVGDVERFSPCRAHAASGENG